MRACVRACVRAWVPLMARCDAALFFARHGCCSSFVVVVFRAAAAVVTVVLLAAAHAVLVMTGMCRFLADSIVHGHVASGSQQQWLTRNTNTTGWQEGVWNMVFVGVEGAPEAHCGVDSKMCASPYVVRVIRDFERQPDLRQQFLRRC